MQMPPTPLCGSATVHTFVSSIAAASSRAPGPPVRHAHRRSDVSTFRHRLLIRHHSAAVKIYCIPSCCRMVTVCSSKELVSDRSSGCVFVQIVAPRRPGRPPNRCGRLLPSSDGAIALLRGAAHSTCTKPRFRSTARGIFHAALHRVHVDRCSNAPCDTRDRRRHGRRDGSIPLNRRRQRSAPVSGVVRGPSPGALDAS